MAETKRASMQHLTQRFNNGIPIDSTTIEDITGYGCLHRCHVDTNLMCPSCFYANLSQTPAVGEALKNVPVGGRIFAVNRPDCHFFPIHRMPANRRNDTSVTFTRTTKQQGMVCFPYPSVLKICHQGTEGMIGLGNQHDTGGFFVQTVNNTRTPLLNYG